MYGVRVTGRPLTDILAEVRHFEKERDDGDYSDGEDYEDRCTSFGFGDYPRHYYDSVPDPFRGRQLSVAPQAAGKFS